jgi:hypothetical protein
MRLMGRDNAATVKAMRRIAEAAAVPRRGTAVFGEELYGGWLWGSRGRQGQGDYMSYYTGIRLLFNGNCAPALIPLVQPEKGR